MPQQISKPEAAQWWASEQCRVYVNPGWQTRAVEGEISCALEGASIQKKMRGRGLGRGEFVRFTVDVAPEREVALLRAAVKRWALGHRLFEFLGAE
jgi:hypothetical protein